jgi:hypothetical protein
MVESNTLWLSNELERNEGERRKAVKEESV